MHHHHHSGPFDDGDDSMIAYFVSQGSGRQVNMTALWITMILFLIGAFWLINTSQPVSHQFDDYPATGTSAGR